MEFIDFFKTVSFHEPIENELSYQTIDYINVLIWIIK